MTEEEKEIRESNYLIDSFMDSFSDSILKRALLNPENFYHESWDCLMPVVETIGNYIFDDMIKGEEPDTAYMRTFSKCQARINRFGLYEGETQIEATYKAVIDFIKWYNNKKLKK